MVEYVLVFAGVVIVLIAATGPSGIITDKTRTALDTAVRGVECMTAAICYDPAGCPTACGNGCCEAGEDLISCPQDCVAPPSCGDGQCEGTETCSNCAKDCGSCPGAVCGDGACNGGENCTNCSVDCGSCPVGICGDGACNGGEDCISCSTDCGPCLNCGNGICDSGETCTNCPQDCNCGLPCGNGVCDNLDECSTCPGDCTLCDDCGLCSSGSCQATWIDPPGSCSELMFFPDISSTGQSFTFCPSQACEPSSITASCTNGEWVIDSGSCAALVLGENCGDFNCDNADGEACSNCPFDCGNCPPDCDETTFTFSGCGEVTLPGDTSQDVYFWQRPCPGGCVGTYTARCDWNGWSIDEGSCDGIECGDGACMSPEDCTTCPDDCGACIPCPAMTVSAVCGNFQLPEKMTPGVVCDLCPGAGSSCGGSYCAACSSGGSWILTGGCLTRVCGDGVCVFSAENSVNCPQDCILCGDGVCDPGETCESCSQDCAC